jgi:DNA polymerase-3 subunit delta'
MGIPSQNALLKVLEEPPKYGVFILLTDNPEKLLPTVRSRCTQLQLRPLPEYVLQEALQKDFPNADQDALRSAAYRSGGYLGQARTLLQDGTQLPPQSAQFLDCFAQRDSYGLLQLLTPMEKWKRDQLIPILIQWQELLESSLACRSGMPPRTEQIRTVAAQRSSQELLDAITALQKAVEYAQGNVSPAAVCGYLVWALR